MDLSPLLNLIPFPWSLLVAVALPIILHRLGIPVPFLPKPTPGPAPEPKPSPVDPAPIAPPSVPNRPALNLLLSFLMALRGVKPGDLDDADKKLIGHMLTELQTK